jgi:hypothetical protein
MKYEPDGKKRQRLHALYLVASGQARHRHEVALQALQAKLQEPHGVAGYDQILVWLAEVHQATFAYSSVHALVRYKLPAKPKRPRPSHGKKVPQP